MATTKLIPAPLSLPEAESDQQKLWEYDWNIVQFYWHIGLIHPFFMPWSLFASISAVRSVLKDYWVKCNNSKINAGQENR